MKQVVSIKNIYDYIGTQTKLIVPKGTKGRVVGKYEWGPHKYIVVRFSNKKKLEFGDESHPLISYKGYIEGI